MSEHPLTEEDYKGWRFICPTHEWMSQTVPCPGNCPAGVDRGGPEAVSTKPDDLEARLMAIVTDAWLHAGDRTLPQLHNEARALLTLVQRR